MERKRTTPAKVLKNWAGRGSFRVYAEKWGGNAHEVSKIETHKDLSRIPEGYVNLLFAIHPEFDADAIADCKRRGSKFVGRCWGPISLDSAELWYEPVHAALQSKVDKLLEA